MRRELVLAALVMSGALSMTIAAQRGGEAPPKVVEVDKIKDNLYVLKGGGGNTALFITGTGAVVIDTKLPGWGQPLLEKIRTLTTKPITMVINTHTHGDHVSGQLEFPANIEVVAHENTKTYMQAMDDFKKPENAKFLPKRTFKDTLSLLSGNDRIELHYFGRGHTGGDAWVVFPALKVAHAGDQFANKGLPLVDFKNGGSSVDFPQTLAKAQAGVTGVDTIITGHSGQTMTVADLKEFTEFNKDFVAWAQAEKRAGKTAEQAAAEFKAPEKYKGYSSNVPTLFGGAKGYMEGVYNEIK